jgi:hypothetical protein
MTGLETEEENPIGVFTEWYPLVVAAEWHSPGEYY